MIQRPPVPRRSTLTLLAALFVAAALGACGGDDREDAQQTVRDFVNATNERDADAFCGELVTQEFLESTTGASGDKAQDECRRQMKAVRGLEVELVRFRRTAVDGDSARVTAILRTQGARSTQTLRLKKEDGDWKLIGAGSGD